MLGDPNENRLVEGTVVKYEGRIWFVGLVNDSRARLDPISDVGSVMPESGRSFRTYGSSANITPCPGIPLPEVDIETLDEFSLKRLCNLMETYELDKHRSHRKPRLVIPDEDDEAGDDTYMAPTAAGTPAKAAAANAAAAPLPVATKTNRPATTSADRLAAAKASLKKAAAAAPVKGASKGKAKGPAVRDKECVCGCGGATAGYFVPGHDARFKGLMLKVERGKAKKEEVFSKAVIAQYQWKRRGDGEVTTKNYKGEPHQGYSPQ